MARSRSSSRHTNGSRGTQPVVNGNGPSIQPATSTRSGEDLRAQLTNPRSDGAPTPAPPVRDLDLIREGMAVFEQASTGLARVMADLRARIPADPGVNRRLPAPPQPPPTRGRSGPSTQPPQAPVTQGEVNSPRRTNTRGGGDSLRDRRQEDDGRRSNQTRPATERLGSPVPARERLGPRPAANQPPPAESCSRRQARRQSATRRSPGRGTRVPHRRAQASRVERSGETNGRAPSSHRAEVEQLQRRMDGLQKKVDERDGSPEPQDVLSSPFANAIIEEPLPRDFCFPTIKAYSGTTDPRAHLTRGARITSRVPQQVEERGHGVADFDAKSTIVIFRNNMRSGAFHQDLIRYPPKTYTDLMDKAVRYADAEAAEKRKKEQEEGRGRKDKAPQEERKAPRPHRREYAEGPG
ncbi:PREDICTED: uncharacterized protein LOC109155047 [Ipomoea nil]|uniref:uncharacterized protein LOC109155047 n=1 Tax=Ipomoea nil TaxID=35883 RepID=UPI00090145F4|nr:PREDICTED: uncharacterized protein LOC109155047 [Ipomoea nil]